MFRILPFVAAAQMVLPELPVELWSTILRFLDPVSLLVAVRTNSLWSAISENDPILRVRVKEQILAERQKRHEETINPGLLISVVRPEPAKLFASNRTKIVRRRIATEIRNEPRGFLARPQQKRKRRNEVDRGAAKKKISLRC